MIIFEADYADVIFHENDFVVEIKWKKVNKMSIEEYKNALTLALDYQEKHSGKVKFYLSDIRDQGILSPDYRKWFQEEAVPQALKNGLLAGAVIFEGNVFKKYYLNNIMNTTKKFGLPFKFFGSKQEAIEWFKTL
jgi:hypothetical protein